MTSTALYAILRVGAASFLPMFMTYQFLSATSPYFVVLSCLVLSTIDLPRSFSPISPHVRGSLMDEAESLFKNLFQPRLEYQLSGTPPVLTDPQRNQLNRWAELLAETDESLRARSKQRQSVRRQARTFAKNVHMIAAELFDLCFLSFTISGLVRV